MEANQVKYNQDLKQWFERLKNLMAYRIVHLSKEGKGKLIASLRVNFRKDYGEISSGSVRFERHGIYFAKGAGRGYKVVQGKIIKVPEGGKVMRQPRDWHSEPIDKNIEQLISIVANYHADAAVDATNIKIR